MTQSLDHDIKQAEKEKYLAEAKKAVAEQEKLQFELEELKKESSKKWFLKKEFGYNLSKWTIAITFILFFINYVILPAANKDNIELQTKNAMVSDSLYKRNIILEKEANTLSKLKDSLKQVSALYSAANKNLNFLINTKFKNSAGFELEEIGAIETAQKNLKAQQSKIDSNIPKSVREGVSL